MLLCRTRGTAEMQPQSVTYEATVVANPIGQQNGWYTRTGSWTETDPLAVVREWYVVFNGVVIYNNNTLHLSETPTKIVVGSVEYTPGPFRGQLYGWGGDVCNTFDLVVTQLQ